MNWHKIKEDYPRSWHLLTSGYEILGREILSNALNVRELYDFFDEREIFVTIEHDEDYNVTTEPHWYYKIDGDFLIDNKLTGEKDVDCIYSTYCFEINMLKTNGLFAKNRKEAEEAAFMQAFEILESRK